MKTANFTDLRRNLRGYLDAVTNDCETVIINRDGGAAVVMLSLDEYNAIKETEYIMQSPAMVAAVRRGMEQAAAGQVTEQRDGESVEDFLSRI